MKKGKGIYNIYIEKRGTSSVIFGGTMRAYLGIDGGSIYYKSSLFVPSHDPLSHTYFREKERAKAAGGIFYFLECEKGLSEPLQNISRHVDHVISVLKSEGIPLSIGATGRMGKAVAKKTGALYENDFASIVKYISHVAPETRTVFEIGAETSRFINLKDENGRLFISEYGTNGECAAGTGSFIDQQAARMKVRVEDIGELVECVSHHARIAGRCSVFAKSDMIHAQQKGATPEEILKGLMYAVARNFKSNVCRGRSVNSRILFLGGVAGNRGVVKALEDLFELKKDGIWVPPSYRYFSSAGVALLARDGVESAGEHSSPRKRGSSFLKKVTPSSHPPLSLEKVLFLETASSKTEEGHNGKRDLFLGIDVGSVSTNFALIDSEGNLVHEVYVRTEGRPIEVVEKNLREIGERISLECRVRGVATTGSGRELVGELVGADVITDEITAHKTGASFIAEKYFSSTVDTIFEIGGQDSKFISIRDGVVVDFAMNDACAAGTGSFLEEQAERIGISIKGDFSEMAMGSKTPSRLGERCTVFMEQDVSSYMNRGEKVDDIVAGLAYAVVLNYLNRVVRGRQIGSYIYFQGGTAYNESVAAAFSIILGKKIIVPPHNGVMGAIGAALVALEKYGALEEDTRFRGFDLNGLSLAKREFVCRGCSNECDVKESVVEGEKTYWGDKCAERFRKPPKVPRKPVGEDLVSLKVSLLESLVEEGGKPGKLSVALPRALYFFERFPFWHGFFRTLGVSVTVTAPTSRGVAEEGAEISVSETCFPVMTSMGHVSKMIREIEDADFYFLPNVINSEKTEGCGETYYCPWGQTLPYMVSSNPVMAPLLDSKMVTPTVYFRDGEKSVSKDLHQSLRRFGWTGRQIRDAVRAGYESSRSFEEQFISKGRKALERLEREKANGVLLVGRPYNIYDREMNLNIPSKIREYYGIDVIPYDCLPGLDDIDIKDLNWNMFWTLGRKIISASRFAAKRKWISIIYFTNFKCGPDSFVRHYVEEASGRPFLALQFDGHGNDAGYMTRVEAYLDSKGVMRWWNGK